MFLNKPSLFRLGANWTGLQDYKKLLRCYQGACRVLALNKKTLRIYQNGLETQFPSNVPLVATHQDAIETIKWLTRRNDPVRRGPVRTENTTKVKKESKTRILSTKLCDMWLWTQALIFSRAVGIVRWRIPPNHSMTYRNIYRFIMAEIRHGKKARLGVLQAKLSSTPSSVSLLLWSTTLI